MTVVEERVKEIPEMHGKIDKIGTQLQKISEYMIRTDNKIETNEKEIRRVNKASFGVWARRHPLKFGIGLVLLFLFIIPTTREGTIRLLSLMF